MGLDMYLTAKRFIWEDKEREKVFTSLKEIFPDLPNLTPEEISFKAMYWRKTNAIHEWFVKNVQDGIDECKSHHVSLEDLKKLLEAVKDVLKNPEKADEILPTTGGFFFGDTKYHDYYWGELKRTKKELVALLKSKGLKDLSFEYRSSW